MNLDREVFLLDITYENDDNTEGGKKNNGDTEGYRRCCIKELILFLWYNGIIISGIIAAPNAQTAYDIMLHSRIR